MIYEFEPCFKPFLRIVTDRNENLNLGTIFTAVTNTQESDPNDDKFPKDSALRSVKS